MKDIKKLLIDLGACSEAIEWAESLNYDWSRIYNECERGDWLLWLHYRTNKNDLRQRTLVKGLIAKSVEHIMTDQRSKDAVKAAIDYGNGLINEEQLSSSAAASDYAAYAAAAASASSSAAASAAAAYAAAAGAAYAAAAASAYAAASSSADASAYAAYADAAGAGAAAYASAAAAGAGAAAYASAAKKETLRKSADIFRYVIKIEDFNV